MLTSIRNVALILSVVAAATIRTGDLTTERSFHTATLLRNEKVLIAGGSAAHGLTSAELYDPASGTFSPTGRMNAPAFTRYKHTATLLRDDTVLLAGGDTTFAEVFDPATGTFTRVGDMATPRLNAT